MKRTFKDYAILSLKGVAMGAADVVPGVSGGTIAFIVGIYEELINSIKSIDAEAFKLFFQLKWADLWKKVNGNFLISVLTGIAISVLSLAKIITYLLENHPILVWSFFFGLVLASTLVVSKQIKQFSIDRWIAFIAGTLCAFYITVSTPATTPDSAWFIFLCGAIAICAMILPGISGSFILVLLGKYFYIMNALKSFDLVTIITFMAGASIGIVSFANVLSWLLKKYHDITIAILGGFMLGSLNKVWPWKETIKTYIDRHGATKPLIETNIMPNEYLLEAGLLMIAGFVLVILLERLGKPAKTK